MAGILRFRNARGELVDVESVPATQLKNEPGSVIERVAAGGAVAITRHNRPRAVLVSYEDFQELARARHPSLEALGAEFDALLDEMQAPTARRALAEAFAASPAEIARHAVAAALPKALAAKRARKRVRTARGGR